MNYNNRIYGASIIKAVNSNYNADFSHQPRTLPNGVVYATDKALKYAIKNYLKDSFSIEKIFYLKRFRLNTDDFVPYSLMEAFCAMFPELAEITDAGTKKEKVKLKASKKQVGKALLDCLDIRLFGATFAMKGSKKEDNLAISIHGPVQINHGINIWNENNIYSEQIMSPFRNPGESNKGEEEQIKAATTLGRQSKLQEGHYLHHFSVNPKNLQDITQLVGDGASSLTNKDIDKLKEALLRGVTLYDSASKAGSENEALIWVQLKSDSKAIMPNFSQLVEMKEEKENGKVVLDCSALTNKIENIHDDIDEIEFYINKDSMVLENAPSDTIIDL
ncbi:MAG TPA: type I CRISPR-associated protein Cas7 [Bacteroidales bacterium]|nr:type I CRISPR-associated protein Cas7 [Balneolales bacterium]HYX10162.1 type I CRISPR-associated protein Cas7 [Bacteroidales bacterium]